MGFKNGSLIREGVIAFSIKIVGAILGFVYTIILSHYFNADGVGVYSLALSITTLGIIFSKFGLENTLIKFSAIYQAGNYGKSIRKLYRDTVLFSLLISSVLTMLFIVLTPVISENIYDNENLKLPLILMSITILPKVMLSLIVAIFKGIGRVKVAIIIESMLQPIINVVLVLLAIILIKPKDITFVIGVYFLGNVIATIITLCLGQSYKVQLNDTKVANYDFNQILKISLPLLMITSMNYILSSTDTIMLGFWVSDSDIGVYTVAIKITQISSMLLIAINSILGPKFAVMYVNNDIKAITKIMKDTTRYMGFASLVFFAAIFIFSDGILSIFGKEFVVGKTVLLITAVGQVIVLATGPVATLLMMTGNEKVHRDNTMMCGGINIILNLLLIPFMGITGAALATSISLIIKNIVAVVAVYQKLDINLLKLIIKGSQ